MAIAKKAAVKKVGVKKEEGFLLLIVFKTTHGRLFTKHSHYQTNLIEVKSDDEAKGHVKAAKKAAEIMNEQMSINVEVVIAERVKATNPREMHEQVHAKMGGLKEALDELIKNLDIK